MVAGATQYEFPEMTAEPWQSFGASHLYGSKGIKTDGDTDKRRNSI
jgi:hypothetical protein